MTKNKQKQTKMKRIKEVVNRFKMIGIFIFIAVSMSSCNESIPAGYVGMVKTPDGIQEEVLMPGHHSCYGRDEMLLVETLESTETIKLSILCKDELDFKFDVKVRSRLVYSDAKGLKDILNSQGSKMTDGKLTYKTLYSIYVEPVVDAVSMSVVSKYTTMQISENRDKISKAIFEQVCEKLKGTPMLVTDINLSNFDYPDVVTKAMEAKKKREIDIETEKANQALKILEIQNREIIADKEIVVRKKEAQAEAVYISIIESALNNEYLLLKNIEAKKVLYERVAAGDKVIVDTDATPLLQTGK
ncbi:MAG: SPFH domain-containing protein [Nanoarchaeota archaeon]|mgnify:CR=1 FL=1